MEKGGESMESVVEAILCVMKVLLNVIHQGIVLAVMKKCNHVVTPEIFVNAQGVSIIGQNLSVRF